ncbi:hypothetical protein [Acidaminococcus sp.]|uniref:hypothetical protein n=1 Tax=Acidaminococcus sp. TaxID=1872103 RepID=UPI0035214505
MKDKETERRVKRCTGCRWLEPPEFARYSRLWEFLTCRACRKMVRTLAVCPVTRDRKPE